MSHIVEFREAIKMVALEEVTAIVKLDPPAGQTDAVIVVTGRGLRFSVTYPPEKAQSILDTIRANSGSALWVKAPNGLIRRSAIVYLGVELDDQEIPTIVATGEHLNWRLGIVDIPTRDRFFRDMRRQWMGSKGHTIAD